MELLLQDSYVVRVRKIVCVYFYTSAVQKARNVRNLDHSDCHTDVH